MVEDVLVATAVDSFYALQGANLGQDELHEAALLHQLEAEGRLRREHNLVELGGDALSADNLDALGVAGDGLEGVVGDAEAQLAGEAHGAHHAQGVVAEGDVGVEGRAEDALIEVVDAAEGVHQLAIAVSIQTDGKGVDGEVAPPLVVLEGAVLNDGLAAVVAVALAAGADELQLQTFRLRDFETSRLRVFVA